MPHLSGRGSARDARSESHLARRRRHGPLPRLPARIAPESVQRDGGPHCAEHPQSIGETLHARQAGEGPILGMFCTLYVSGLPIADSFCSPSIAPDARAAVLEENLFGVFP